MRHVFEVSTGFGLCGVAAIIERFETGRREDRVLLVMNTVQAFEAVPAVHELPEYAPLLELFGRVVHLNDLIAPEHPHGWSPAPNSHAARLATAQLHAACGIEEGRSTGSGSSRSTAPPPPPSSGSSPAPGSPSTRTGS
ncbi:hypothetical protein [Amnibacterium kyonggiense]